MLASEIALGARAKGIARHLIGRATLETLAEADDLGAFARGLSRLAAIDPIGESAGAFAVERAIGRTTSRFLRTLYRWQAHEPGVLDVFAARQDHRSLRALLRGAVQGAPADARLDGLLPTPSLPQLALADLARRASPAEVVHQLVPLAHPDAPRLLPLVRKAHPDLLAIDIALLQGFAERAGRATANGDEHVRDFVHALIDLGNVQTALVIAREGRAAAATDFFVHGGRWLTASAFASAARAGSTQGASMTMATALAGSPLASLLPPGGGDVASLDRAFLMSALKRLTHAARIDPLSSASILRVLLRIEAQQRDLRNLAWGAALGTPAALRKQQLVTPP
ncbi:MAG TPA: V-type ATPase subunit [Vicinamibacterales bacterium]|nr:V-type ATPase subunit [Vicinamibacterales bacterium]